MGTAARMRGRTDIENTEGMACKPLCHKVFSGFGGEFQCVAAAPAQGGGRGMISFRRQCPIEESK